MINILRTELAKTRRMQQISSRDLTMLCYKEKMVPALCWKRTGLLISLLEYFAYPCSRLSHLRDHGTRLFSFQMRLSGFWSFSRLSKSLALICFLRSHLEDLWKHLGSQKIFTSLRIQSTRSTMVPQADIRPCNAVPATLTCHTVPLRFLLLFSLNHTEQAHAWISNCRS